MEGSVIIFNVGCEISGPARVMEGVVRLRVDQPSIETLELPVSAYVID